MFTNNNEKAITELLQLAKAGDQQAIEGLLKQYQPLIKCLTRDYGRAYGGWDEDLEQELSFKFSQCIDKFLMKGTNAKAEFTAFIKESLKNRAIDYAKSEDSRRKKEKFSIDDEGEWKDLPSCNSHSTDAREFLDEVIAQLTDKE